VAGAGRSPAPLPPLTLFNPLITVPKKSIGEFANTDEETDEEIIDKTESLYYLPSMESATLGFCQRELLFQSRIASIEAFEPAL
jgi:hypothetical protein